MATAPHLVRWAEEYAEDGLVIASVIGEEKGGAKAVEAFVERNGMEHPVGYDAEGGLGDGLGVKAFPLALLLDATGRIVWEGVFSAKGGLRERIELLLDGETPYTWLPFALALGHAGAVDADGAWRVEWPRGPVPPKDGAPPPSRVRFFHDGDFWSPLEVEGTLVLGPGSPMAAIGALRSAGIEVLSLTPRIDATPRILELRGEGYGTRLADALRLATRAPTSSRPQDANAEPERFVLDPPKMAGILRRPIESSAPDELEFVLPPMVHPGLAEPLTSRARFRLEESGVVELSARTWVPRTRLQIVLDAAVAGGVEVLEIDDAPVDGPSPPVRVELGASGDPIELVTGLRAVWSTLWA